MTRTGSGAAFEVRSYREEDEPRVLDLLQLAFGSWPVTGSTSKHTTPADFFRWKHQANPFGRSLVFVAEADGRIIGALARMRWQFVTGNRTLHALNGVDTVTHPDYQRIGVYKGIAREADKAVPEDVDVFIGTPNDQSLSPTMMLEGRLIAGRLALSVRVRRPIRFARGLRSREVQVAAHRPGPPVDAETAAEALGDSEGVSLLLEESAATEDPRFVTPRDLDYLRWRYTPLLDYRAIREEQGGRLSGLAIFRVRPRGVLWESRVAELLVAPGDRRTGRRLLRRVVRSAPVSLLTCCFPARSAQAHAAARNGFLRAPARHAFVVQSFRDDILPDPTDIDSWALSLGDLGELELF